MPPIAEPTPARDQQAVAPRGAPPHAPGAGEVAPSPGLARRARGWWASRWRLWVASFGLVATLTAVGVAALQQWIAWRTQDALVERALRRSASYSARIFDDGVRRGLSDLPMHALAPVLGAIAWSRGGEEPLRLADLARHLRSTPMWRSLSRDSLLALAVVDYRGGSGGRIAVQLFGRAADSAAVAALAREVLPGAERWRTLNTAGTRFSGRVDGALHHVLWAWQKDRQDRPVALVVLVTDARARLRLAGSNMFAFVPLLPPPVAGEGDASEDGGEAAVGRDSARVLNHRLVAIRMRDVARPQRVFFTSPNWNEPWVARSPLRGTAPSLSAAITVEAVLNPEVRGLFPEARSSRAAQLMLGGVLALAAMMALAAIAGLRRRQELAQARELFVSSISHELRTPLTQIRLFSESLLNERARSPEQAGRWLRVIDREARRLGDLVDNALLHARGLRHDVHLPHAPLALHEPVAAMEDATRPFAAARDARLEVDVPADVRVLGDARALRHVLQNLVDNALKHGPPGQTVRLSVAAAPDTVDVRIDDEGPGVAAADRRRIWEPFVRLERDEATGTGLGLSVVRTLVQAGRGRVWVEDAPGGGARFVVRLPRA